MGDDIRQQGSNRLAKAKGRREQILSAAGACARQSGFHAASMAKIARTAGISVGQIYRYFDNKEAIIAAIVAEDVARVNAVFAFFDAAPGDLLANLQANLPEQIEICFETERAALDLEILAEAARNQKVAVIVREADATQMTQAARLLEKLRKPDWTQDELEIRAEILGIIFDGLQTRAVRRPHQDRAALTEQLKAVIAHVLT
ncbi:TetR/AcrR family transcriptional regulator [soil metagenome]